MDEDMLIEKKFGLEKISSKRFEEVPLILQFIYVPISYLLAWGFVFQGIIFRALCRFEYRNEEIINQYPNHIFCLWHENVSLFFLAHYRFVKPNIFLSFPLWFMRPIHYFKKIIGVRELAYGATGHEGKEALQKVVDRLKEGWSTFLTPDGPHGPLKVAKHGVLQMSLKTGVPIIPIRFYLEKEWRLPTWDKKRYPVFFHKMIITYGDPIIVTKDNYGIALDHISSEMHTPVSMD